MILLTLVLLILLVVVASHWKWDVHAGPLYVSFNSSHWSQPFATEHGPQSLPWWQPVKVMPWRCGKPGDGSWPCWNVFVYTRRRTRCHFVAWRSRDRRSWRVYRSALYDGSAR